MNSIPALARLDVGALPWPDFLASLVLVVVLWIGRTVVVHVIRRRSALPQYVVRRWIATSRNVMLFLLLLGLVLIWAPQLRTFALSIAAVAVAIVVATKEIILCVSGALMRASTGAFAVGDWIEVAGIRGEVVDHSLLATTLQEFHPNSYHYTGRSAVVPNSVFFGSPIRNLSAVRDYTLHSFSVTTEPDVDLPAQEPKIVEIVDRHYAAYRADAAAANARLELRSGVDLRDPEVRVRLSTTDLGKPRVTVSLFCPTLLAEQLEDAITRDLMSLLRSVRPDAARDAAAKPPA